MVACSLIVPTILPKQFAWFWQQNEPYLHHCQLLVVATFPPPDDVKSHFDTCIVAPKQTRFGKDNRWITVDKPLGFARTVNTGFAANQAACVGTCNDDVVLSPGWEKMCTKLTTSGNLVAAINPVIVRMSGEVESAGVEVLPQGKAVPISAVNYPDQLTPIPAFNGACVMFSKAFLDAVGGFDESFNSYLEDIELSLRAKRNGWQILLDPSITVAHVGHATTTHYLGPKKAWLDAVNWWRIVLRYTRMHDWLHFGLSILTERARNLSGVIKAYGRYPTK